MINVKLAERICFICMFLDFLLDSRKLRVCHVNLEFRIVQVLKYPRLTRKPETSRQVKQIDNRVESQWAMARHTRREWPQTHRKTENKQKTHQQSWTTITKATEKPPNRISVHRSGVHDRFKIKKCTFICGASLTTIMAVISPDPLIEPPFTITHK